MAMMIDTKTLRLEPDGVKTEFIVVSGTQVDILDTKGDWSKVRPVLPMPVKDRPTGWVVSAAIDANAVPETAPMKPDSFAAECVLNGLFVGVNAHYLMAAAQLKSGLKTDKQGDEVGPYRMRQGEWDAVREAAAFEMDFEADQIANWRAQSLGFAVLAHAALEGLTSALTRRPTAAELYAAQLIGAKVAGAAIGKAKETVDELLKAAADGDLPAGNLTRDVLLARTQEFLGGTGKLDLGKIEAALDKALEETRAIAAAAEADLLDAAASPVLEEGAPEQVLMRRPDFPNAAAPKGHLVERMQAALIASGHMPATSNGKSTNDGLFGSGTEGALLKWQAANGFGATGVLTNAQWSKLTGTPAPDIYERCAQLTAAFEGTNFGGVNQTDFDKTGVTFGYHGYTLDGGNLQKFLESVDKADPNAIDAAFGGGKAAIVRSLFELSGAAAKAKAQQFFTGGTMRPEWNDAFRAFGETDACKLAQLAFSRATYWKDGEAMRAALGLSEPLSYALCFDVAIQLGPELPTAKAVAKKFTARMSERDKRIAFGDAIVKKATFKDDVRARKVDTLADGEGVVHKRSYRLNDWGFALPEGAEADLPTHVAAPSANPDFDAWFAQNLPNYKAFAPGEFLYKGGSHQTNGLNSDPPKDLWPNIIKLAKTLADLKKALGNPRISFNSVYRNRRYNQSVGGARNSLHMRFMAADIVAHDGKGPRDWAAVAHEMRRKGVFAGGVGVYRTFLHIDTRGKNEDW